MSMLQGLVANADALIAAERMAKQIPQFRHELAKRQKRAAAGVRGQAHRRGQYGDAKRAILAYMSEHPGANCGEVSAALGLNYGATSVAMSKLRVRGEIQRVPSRVERVRALMCDGVARSSNEVAATLGIELNAARRALVSLASSDQLSSEHVYQWVQHG